MREKLISEREEARVKALDSLSKYKFQMFGYWAAIWVHLNRIIGDRQPSPFAEIVTTARQSRPQAPDVDACGVQGCKYRAWGNGFCVGHQK